MPDERRGILLAVVAYVSWGFLSPVGSILLDSMGPVTLNALRTLLALPILFLLFGRRTSLVALRSIGRDHSVWVVGVVWLGLTFIPYLWSLKFLEPSVTTLTVYVAPLLVAAWQRYGFREPVSPFVVPAAVITLVGGYLITLDPSGLVLDRQGVIGLVLATVGVFGWVGYTIHLKVLTRTREPNSLTLAAFITSAVAFTLVAFAVEGFAIEWNQSVGQYLVLYVLFPTVISFWLYTVSLKYASAATVAVLLGVELLSTVIISYYLTDEKFGPLKLVGFAVVLGAVTLYLWDEQGRARRPALAQES